MIISASRRTDIPNYYSKWFIKRINEGFVYVRNPVNPRSVSKITLSPDLVDCIVFWTKNPEPMLSYLDEFREYTYYFQFTLTGYGKDIEPDIPDKFHNIIPVFKKLSSSIGKERIVWRYDPIIFTPVYTPEYHLHAFSKIASELCGYTDKCVISFLDEYAKIKKTIRLINAYELETVKLKNFAQALSKIAYANNMSVSSCAEAIDLSDFGVLHNCCIDKNLIEKLAGCQIMSQKDKNQRPECGCIESIDVGAYNTCKNGCIYCYANHSRSIAEKSFYGHDSSSPVLCSCLSSNDKISERKTKSLKI